LRKYREMVDSRPTSEAPGVLGVLGEYYVICGSR